MKKFLLCAVAILVFAGAVTPAHASRHHHRHHHRR